MVKPFKRLPLEEVTSLPRSCSKSRMVMSQIRVLYLKPVASAWPGHNPPLLNETAISPSELYSDVGYAFCIATWKAAGKNWPWKDISPWLFDIFLTQGNCNWLWNMKLSLAFPEPKTKILLTFSVRDMVIKYSLLTMKVFVQWHSELEQIENVW